MINTQKSPAKQVRGKEKCFLFFLDSRALKKVLTSLHEHKLRRRRNYEEPWIC